MFMEGRPAVEEKKATRKIVMLAIHHSMRIVCRQIDDIRLPQTRRNKSHPHIRFCSLRASENITRSCFIERPNSNLTIPSGFFFFHRGLPFLSGVIQTNYTGVYMCPHICIHTYTQCFDTDDSSKGLHISKLVLRQGACSASISLFFPRGSLPARVLRRLGRRMLCV